MARVLYINGQCIRVYSKRRYGVDLLGEVSCAASGNAALLELLAADGLEPVAILVDLIEEEFREEALPHTLGPDRQRLHLRHAGKIFRATPYRHHRVVGRQKTGRKDDQVLFSALTNRDNIEPLLQLLQEHGIPVSGIHSLPILTRRLLKVLGAYSGDALIITEQSGTLRETYVRDSQVHFSRLAPFSVDKVEHYHQQISAEVQKTERYLQTLRLLDRDTVLDVYVITDERRSQALETGHKDTESLHYHALEITDLARSCGFRNYPDTPTSDPLFAYLLARYPIVNHYGQPGHLRGYRTWQAKLAVKAACWLIAVGSVTAAGVNVLDGRQMSDSRLQLVEAAARLETDYRRLEKQLPVAPQAALAMQEALGYADHIASVQVDLDRLYRLTGAALGDQPNLRMDRFSWFLARSPDEQQYQPPTDTQNGQMESERYLVSTISGYLEGFDGNYLRADEQVRRLSSWLARQPGVVKTVIVRKPLDTSVGSDIRGGIVSGDAIERAQFELRMVMEVSSEPV